MLTSCESDRIELVCGDPVMMVPPSRAHPEISGMTG